MLRKNAVNYILIYRGSFNPPHIGHRALLAHTFFRSSYENTVAAFIVPSSNDLLEEKMGTTDAGEIPAIVLTRAQHAEL
jgi:nicotinic acid mononucleotide adenylyltransferase